LSRVAVIFEDEQCRDMNASLEAGWGQGPSADGRGRRGPYADNAMAAILILSFIRRAGLFKACLQTD
jgi:hypothetical protein